MAILEDSSWEWISEVHAAFKYGNTATRFVARNRNDEIVWAGAA